MKIDLIYLWVDGDDKKWLARKNAELKKFGQMPVESTGRFRFDDNDELLFSLRSVEKFAPWINHIFIITDNQTPKWLNIKNPKVTIVDHTEIMPENALPNFNSSVIEFFLQNVPALAEHFIFANDDMLFMAPTKPSYFFTKNGDPIIRANDKGKIRNKLSGIFPVGQKFYQLYKNASIHDRCGLNSRRIAYEILGPYNYAWDLSHNIDPYKKSDMIKVTRIPKIKEKIKEMENCHFRNDKSLHRIIFYIFGIAKYGYKMIGRRFLTRLWQFLTLRFKDQPIYSENITKLMSRKLFARKLVCVEDPTDEVIRKSNHEYLLKIFPVKSEFEK